ncbi:TGACG-sequence-specific DNA-binding protein TGA-2.1 [Hibiscus syriacus]|uniref:TGACG-sequence-specific DNA-binding protein TGA-2.1 n=1 Tax=Hibiscus syriacus TaxID=106335 RepID=A0A6A3CZ41_HIBSY|nr:bZIP transcription factor TGA10-like isoform X2 [Hibiscus syriacus]KAE8734406.1 TGACG-sequence-specific DNA-binding protein TGA-2.1 [Hibiscus syriacus]
MATSRGNMNHSIQLHHHQNQQQQQHQHQIQEHDQHHQNQIPYAMMQSSSIPGNFISKDTGDYDLRELDQALFLYLDGQDPSTVQDQRHNSGMRPPTLNIFPSQPMHVEPLSSSTKASTGLVSPSASGSKRPSEPSMELVNPKTDASASAPNHPDKAVKSEGNTKGPTSSSEQEGPKTPDPKTLRRLAQNREAARKSRLKKKAYVQQLESSRIRLTQLEQELQRARTQGMFLGGGNIIGGEQGLPVGINNISSDAAVFDMEYARWLEEHHRMMYELRAAVQEHLPENELRMFVDNCLAHFDEMVNLKGMVAKTDVFHLVSGMWKTPAERCFMWIGGFRPSDLIKVIVNQIEPLTEQQIMGICGLQQSTHEAEEALSQGLEALNHSLSDVITSDSLSCPPNMTNYMGQMAIAMSKLSTLEGFVRQADNLRHQSIHRLHQILTTRQAARCLLGIAEYFHRLRALSSLWLTRPRQEQ